MYKSLAGAVNRLITKIRTRNVKCSWPLEKAWTGTDLNTVVITRIKDTHTDSLQNVDAIILLWKVLKRLFAIVQLRRKEEVSVTRKRDRNCLSRGTNQTGQERVLKKEIRATKWTHPRRPRSGQLGQEKQRRQFSRRGDRAPGMLLLTNQFHDSLECLSLIPIRGQHLLRCFRDLPKPRSLFANSTVGRSCLAPVGELSRSRVFRLKRPPKNQLKKFHNW